MSMRTLLDHVISLLLPGPQFSSRVHHEQHSATPSSPPSFIHRYIYRHISRTGTCVYWSSYTVYHTCTCTCLLHVYTGHHILYTIPVLVYTGQLVAPVSYTCTCIYTCKCTCRCVNCTCVCVCRRWWEQQLQ